MTDLDGLPPLLTVAQFAEFFQMSRSWVYREHRRGRVAFLGAGGQTRIRRSELERYLRASERERVA